RHIPGYSLPLRVLLPGARWWGKDLGPRRSLGSSAHLHSGGLLTTAGRMANEQSSGLSRRTALKWMAFAVGAQALGACTPLRGTASERTTRRRLEQVRVSQDRVIRQVVGLRPFRRSGFLVRAEPLGDKLLIHNYGHGGGGVSLSWGSADLVTELALTSSQRQAAV